MGNRSFRRRGVIGGENLLDLKPQSLLNMPPPNFFMEASVHVDNTRSRQGNKPRKKKTKVNTWPLKAFFITFITAMVLSFFSETTLLGVSLPVAILVLFLIIAVGIVFDVVGIAVTLQDVTAYTAMASKRISGAKQAIKLVQNASLVSNICNDVVGDICGIISGAMGAAIAIRLIASSSYLNDLWVNIIISSLIAGLTVSGKACGKAIAVKSSRQIVFFIGRIGAAFSFEKCSKKGKRA